ncbi:L-asparagine transporter-like permease [Mycobacterium sp. OTB74]|jgi:L-asparagine permease|nr:L-asparagine transporter-like permease [Mycobacterium sp. OTB74]
MTTTPSSFAPGLTAEDQGYHHTLKPRQLQMIAIGGAIGTGLFLGAGGRLQNAGPGLFLVYAVCGLFVFFILRALGELLLHRPSSSSTNGPLCANKTRHFVDLGTVPSNCARR